MIIIKSYWDLSFDCHSNLLYLNKFCYLMPVALEKILHIWLKKELFLWSIIVYIGHGFSKYLEKMCIMCPSGNKEIIQENLLFSNLKHSLLFKNICMDKSSYSTAMCSICKVQEVVV